MIPRQSPAQWARDAVGIGVLFGVGFLVMVAYALAVPS